MKSIKMLVVATICALCLVTTAQAQTTGKIGYLDLSKVFDNYDKTKEYDAQLEAKHQAYEKERNQKVDKLKEAQGKLALMKEEEKDKLTKDIEAMREELIAYDQAQKTDLTKQRDEKIREILLEIENIVSDFSKKEGYDLILNDRVLIYGNESMDVTSKVLDILNKSYNKK